MDRHRWIRRAAIAIAVGFGTVRPVTAHVEYVTDRGDDQVAPLSFLLEVLSDPVSLGLIGGGGLVVLVTVVGYLRLRPLEADVRVFRETVAGYGDMIPWLLRLSIGLPLVGAGFAGYLFAPTVPPYLPGLAAPTRLLQIGVGFFLLFGLATRAAAVVGLIVYVVVALTDPRAWLAAEYIPGFIAVTLVGSGRPSADHVLNELATDQETAYGAVDPVHRLARWTERSLVGYRPYVPTVIRIGLGLTFISLGLGEKLLAPGQAMAVVSKYGLAELLPLSPGLWVVGAGLAEIGIGLALILGAFTRASALVALFVFVLTLFGIPDDPVLAHISLFGLASVLLITGSGPLGIDRRIGAEEPVSSPVFGKAIGT